MEKKQSVVVIGGGPAGLTAAWELARDGGLERYDVTVLEETAEFGGISRTVRHNGNRMDIGGHRFFSKDDRIMDWWKDVLPLQGAPSYDDKKLGREHDMEPMKGIGSMDAMDNNHGSMMKDKPMMEEPADPL